MIQIRPTLHPQDWIAIRKLCCLTGLAGKPISDSRWEFFGEQWVGPYEKLPSLSYVSEMNGEVVGYLTAAQNTYAFEKQRRLQFDLPLVGRVLMNKYSSNGDTRRFIKRTLGIEKGPERAFPKRFLKQLKSNFPAHLHMNIEESARGLKIGKLLIERLKEDLIHRGVHGIHLFCGPEPIPFYQKQGFRLLHRIEFKPNVFVSALGVRF